MVGAKAMDTSGDKTNFSFPVEERREATSDSPRAVLMSATITCALKSRQQELLREREDLENKPQLCKALNHCSSDTACPAGDEYGAAFDCIGIVGRGEVHGALLISEVTVAGAERQSGGVRGQHIWFAHGQRPIKG